MPGAAVEDEDEVLRREARASLREVFSSLRRVRKIVRQQSILSTICLLLPILGLTGMFLWYRFANHTVPYESAEYDSGRRTVIIWLKDIPTVGLPHVHREYELANISSVSLEGVTFSPDGREAYIRLKVPFSHRQSDDQTAFAIRSRRR